MGLTKLSAVGKFEYVWLAHNGPTPMIKEYKFNNKRKWRVDFYNPLARIAVEIEGGIWSGGRHIRPAGFIKDIEKYNSLSSFGILLFRVPAHQITSKWVIPIIETARRRI